jgi:hypothetical protein
LGLIVTTLHHPCGLDDAAVEGKGPGGAMPAPAANGMPRQVIATDGQHSTGQDETAKEYER